MTNFEYIKSKTPEEMAALLVTYDYDEGNDTYYNCSDGEYFFSRAEALCHEIKWLNSKMTENDRSVIDAEYHRS